MDFSIIIPAYQAAATLPRSLNALFQQSIDRSRYEIIVVDDGSTDNTAAVAEQVLNKSSAQDIRVPQAMRAVQVIRAPHGGPAHARNLGVEAAHSNLLLFTDADCEPAPDWIEQLSSVFTDPSISGAKGTYRTRQTSLIARFVQQEYQERYDRLQRLAPIDFVDTYAAAYRLEVFIDQGGFDAVGLPTVAVEDQEFSFRVAAAGHRLVFVPEAIVYHQHNTSLWRYFRRKVNISYWKTFILRRHPTKALRDSHTPQMIKVQIALLAAALLMTLAALLFGSSMPIGPSVSIGLWAAFCLSMGSLLIKIARRDPPVLLVAPLMITLRALALGLGMFMGFLRFHVFRRSPPAALP
jgi:cellulose synthase/poly-beta-1,6-N-acetylglucosamine synthase-like glycosyltransferase